MELPSLSVCNSIREQKFLEQNKLVESNVCVVGRVWVNPNILLLENLAIQKVFSNVSSNKFYLQKLSC